MRCLQASHSVPCLLNVCGPYVANFIVVQERRETLRTLRCNVCNTPRKWVVAPSPSLLENNKIVKWNLKTVVVDA